MTRRQKQACLVLVSLLATGWIGAMVGAGRAEAAPAKRVIVLGFDGLDYELTGKLMAEGRLPNFSKVAEMGGFAALGTAVPPQSPVAWSNFITGMDSGGHGIFDFVHRDPTTMFPYLSTSRTEDADHVLKLGKYQIPLSSGKVELLRHGRAFWEVLENHGIHTTIVRIPANFPPSETASEELSGMGTPDITGTYGLFSYYTTNPAPFAGKNISGGKVFDVEVRDGTVEGHLYGPDNPFLVEKTKVETTFHVYVDPVDPVAKIVLGGEERILEVGEWSDWVPVEFDFVPTQHLKGMVRFYLKQVRPEFDLYVTPVNFDPLDPALPISTPESYAAELAKESGRYYTQGMPEDTKAFSDGVFDMAEFVAQAKIAGDEVVAQYPHVLENFHEGLLFYYFGNSDQVSHMLWRCMDPGHPYYDAKRDAPFADVIPEIYEQLDGVVGLTLDRMGPDTLLIIMSDHGFTSWRRAFHLNSWLRDNGYLAVRNPHLKKDPGLFQNVDWRRTRAYGLGLNGLYINLRGRERNGIVPPSQREQLMDEIASKLLAVVDPATGKHAITKVYKREEVYKDRGYLEIGPDLIVGYAKMTRGSNESALGEIPPEVFMDNTEPWSGDHCMDHEAVPGILLTTRPLRKPAATLKDLASSILAEFEIDQADFPAVVE
jgi:predicted AlkP superfamily phosphohydrolase/phosphomutase